MVERYKLLSEEMIDRSTGRRRIAHIDYPVLPYRDSDIYLYSRSGDRLDILAYQYYNDQSMWWIIARANNLGKGTFNIPPGRRLRIPYPITELILTQLVTPELREFLDF